MSCTCELCLRHLRFDDIFTRLDDQDKEFLEGLIYALDQAESDRDYYKAIVQNKWPGSAEVLASYRG